MSKYKKRWELIYDQELRTLNFTLSGRYQRHSTMFFHRTICESIVEMDVQMLLADLYDVNLDYDLSTLDLSSIPQLYESYSVNNNLAIAVIIPQEPQYLNTFLKLEQICNEYSYNVRLFENKTAASIWMESLVKYK